MIALGFPWDNRSYPAIPPTKLIRKREDANLDTETHTRCQEVNVPNKLNAGVRTK
jgi:hypothetical protein